MSSRADVYGREYRSAIRAGLSARQARWIAARAQARDAGDERRLAELERELEAQRELEAPAQLEREAPAPAELGPAQSRARLEAPATFGRQLGLDGSSVDVDPVAERLRLFEPAPAQIPGQTSLELEDVDQ